MENNKTKNNQTKKLKKNKRRICVWGLCFASSGLGDFHVKKDNCRCECQDVWRSWPSASRMRKGRGHSRTIHTVRCVSLYSMSCGSLAMAGGMMAVEEHLGGGATPSNKCLELEFKVMGASCTLNYYTNVPKHTLLFFCAFRNTVVLPCFCSVLFHR